MDVIAIDGGAATGKTTTASRVAARLGFCYVDSGAIYRALAFALRRMGHEDPEALEAEALTEALMGIHIEVEPLPERFVVRLDGREVGPEIRTPEISAASSRVARLSQVRARVRELVRGAARLGSLVVEGRDIGTVVFPDARLKVFLTADLEVRALRRQHDLRRQGRELPLAEVERELEERDRRDTTRAESPLRQADGALVVPTWPGTVDDQVDAIVRAYRALDAETET
ncbi:MAG: (d)CMP kinase [Planctomycetes bacterium]|nr:(d)CMP kinase [Planctomycetota bacterium]